jgi:hypothetical protein
MWDERCPPFCILIFESDTQLLVFLPLQLCKKRCGGLLVIGLEIHAQVTSNSKLFSGASTEFGGEPNTHVSLESRWRLVLSKPNGS